MMRNPEDDNNISDVIGGTRKVLYHLMYRFRKTCSMTVEIFDIRFLTKLKKIDKTFCHL